MLQFEIATSCEPGTELYEAWSELARSPLEDPSWLLTWWKHFGEIHPERELFVVKLVDHGRIVGLAPLYRQNDRIRLLGDGKACTDHLDLIIGGGKELERREHTCAQFWMWLRDADWNSIELECIDSYSLVSSLLCELNDEREEFLVQTSTSTGNCFISLPSSWDEFLGSLSKNHRKRCRKWERTYFDSGRAKILSTKDGWALDEAFDTLVRLHEQRRGEIDGGAFRSTPFRSFLLAAFIRMHHLSMVEIVGLEIDGKVLAVEFELQDSKTCYSYQSGMAPEGLEHSAGSLSIMSRIKFAIQTGRTTYDLMRGTESYKFHWGAAVQPTSNFTLRRGSPANRIIHSTSNLFRFSKSLAKQLVSSYAAAD